MKIYLDTKPYELEHGCAKRDEEAIDAMERAASEEALRALRIQRFSANAARRARSEKP